MSQVSASRRAFVLALLLVSGLLLGACGNKQDTAPWARRKGCTSPSPTSPTRSRSPAFLNPADVEDQSYFEGLGPEVTPPARDETWFAVFMRVSNPTNQVLDPTSQFSIVDTQENHFDPVPVDNVFAYRPEALRGGVVYPDPDSVAGQGAIQGTMVLFKVKIASLQNRPLELKIESEVTPPSEAIVDLDV
jgi:hypothetical protein